MKKNKIFNIIIMCINIIEWIFISGIYDFGINKRAISCYIDLYSNSQFLNYVTVLFITIINLIMLLINIRNKKSRFYYLLIAIMSSTIIFDSLYWNLNKLIIPITIVISISILIYVYKNIDEKKKFVFSIITIVLTIAYVVLSYRDLYDALKLYKWIILFAMIWMMILFIINKEDNKSNIFLNILAVVFIFLSMFTIIRTSILYSDNIKQSYSKIKNYIQNSNDNSKDLIPVCKNDKWGYINADGDLIINFKYDKAYTMDNMYLDGNEENKCKLAMVKEEEQYKLIDVKDNVIEIFKFNKKYPESEMDLAFQSNGSATYLLTDTIFLAFDTNLKFVRQVNTKVNSYKKIYKNDDDTYEIELNNNKYILNLKETSGENQNVINSKDSEEILETYNQTNFIANIKNISGEIKTLYLNVFYDEYKGKEYIYTYSDGYIPYYNYEKNQKGYYDDNLNLNIIDSNYNILDIKNGYLLLQEDGQLKYNKKTIIFDEKNNIKSEYKQITEVKNGYMAKKENNKIVYLDQNFNNKIDEFDCLYEHYRFYNNNICFIGRIENNKYKYDVINLDTGKVIYSAIDDFCGLKLFNDLLHEDGKTLYENFMINEDGFTKFFEN